MTELQRILVTAAARDLAEIRDHLTGLAERMDDGEGTNGSLVGALAGWVESITRNLQMATGCEAVEAGTPEAELTV